jgi:hypothetical protein
MKYLFTLLIMVVLAQPTLAQNPTYQLVLKNDAQVSSTVYEFDINIIRTGATDLELATLQPIMTFNTGISSGSITLSMNAGTSELVSGQQPTGFTVVGNELRIAPKAPPGAGSGTIASVSPGKRVGRFRLTSSVPFTGQTPAISWKNSGSNPSTKVNAYVGGVNTIITDTTGNSSVNQLANPPLPITLASFTAQINPNGSGVRLAWSTLSEINNYGFFVQRKFGTDSLYTLVPNSFIPGHGTTIDPQNYSFIDTTITMVGHYLYRLKQVDLDGSEHFTGSVNVDVTLLAVKDQAPIEFRLNQNYPNPFNPETVIKFSVERTSRTTLRVYNVIGQEVATLFDDIAEAGEYYKVRLNASNLASGAYFYRLESGKKSDLKRMLLLK